MTTPFLAQFDSYTSIMPVPRQLSSPSSNDHPDDRDILITQLFDYSPVSALACSYSTTKTSTVRNVLEYFYRRWNEDAFIPLPQHHMFLFTVVCFLPDIVRLARLTRGQHLKTIWQYHTFHISTSTSVGAAEVEFYVLLRDAVTNERVARWWRKHTHTLHLMP
jgi:hypothetical protein